MNHRDRVSNPSLIKRAAALPTICQFITSERQLASQSDCYLFAPVPNLEGLSLASNDACFVMGVWASRRDGSPFPPWPITVLVRGA